MIRGKSLISAILLFSLISCSEKSNNSSEKQENSEAADVLVAGQLVSLDGVDEITILDTDGAMACSPQTEQVTDTELSDLVYNRALGRLEQKVHCKSDINYSLTDEQKHALDEAWSAMRLVKKVGTASDGSCESASGMEGLCFALKREQGEDERYCTGLADTCTEGTVITNITKFVELTQQYAN